MDNWISVKDRMPEENQIVLSLGDLCGGEFESKIAVVQYCRGYWLMLSSGCGCCDSSHKNVTHWMPRPKDDRV